LLKNSFFRVVMLPICLEGGWSMWQSVGISMSVFGLSHVHHILNGTPVQVVVLQLIYTSIFGAFCSFLFFRTGNFLAATLSHTFCNYMGLPRPNMRHPKWNYIAAAYVVGLISFALLFFPITDPVLHNSIFWNQNDSRRNNNS